MALDNTCLVVRPVSLQKRREAELLPHTQVSRRANTFPCVYRDFHDDSAFRVRRCRLNPVAGRYRGGLEVRKLYVCNNIMLSESYQY